jgi:hypothetical protein
MSNPAALNSVVVSSPNRMSTRAAAKCAVVQSTVGTCGRHMALVNETTYYCPLDVLSYDSLVQGIHKVVH